MEENTMMPLEEFLKQYGFEEEGLTNKEKLKILRQIIFSIDVEKDLEDLKYTKNSGNLSTEEYVNNLNNLDVARIQTLGYILMVNNIQKEERKLKRKEKVNSLKKKVKNIFIK